MEEKDFMFGIKQKEQNKWNKYWQYCSEDKEYSDKYPGLWVSHTIYQGRGNWNTNEKAKKSIVSLWSYIKTKSWNYVTLYIESDEFLREFGTRISNFVELSKLIKVTQT